MFTHSQMHQLQRAARRRRYRHLVLSLQVAMLVFFSDQIFKSWCEGNLRGSERFPILGEILVATRATPLPRSLAIPAAIWLSLLVVFWLRRKRYSLSEMVAFALVLGGGASNLFSRWRAQGQSGAVLDTLQVSLGGGHYFPFGLADAAISGGGLFAVLVLCKKILLPEPRSPYVGDNL